MFILLLCYITQSHTISYYTAYCIYYGCSRGAVLLPADLGPPISTPFSRGVLTNSYIVLIAMIMIIIIAISNITNSYYDNSYSLVPPTFWASARFCCVLRVEVCMIQGPHKQTSLPDVMHCHGNKLKMDFPIPPFCHPPFFVLPSIIPLLS